jgi:hypothetical protein
MQRLSRYTYLINASISSKQNTFYNTSSDLRIRLVAGLYKPTSLKLEHGLILSSLAGQLPVFDKQAHGKRKKQTISLSSRHTQISSTRSLDKIVHEVLPRIPDFLTPKVKKFSGGNYSLKLRQKFPPLPDFEDLISTQMHSEYSGIFLPLHIHLLFAGTVHKHRHSMLQHLKMVRLPFSFYKKNKTPAFDDPVVIEQNF